MQEGVPMGLTEAVTLGLRRGEAQGPEPAHARNT